MISTRLLATLLLLSGGCKPSSDSDLLDETPTDPKISGVMKNLKITYTSVDRLTPGIYEIQLSNPKDDNETKTLKGWKLAESGPKLYAINRSTLTPSGKPLPLHLEIPLKRPSQTTSTTTKPTDRVSQRTQSTPQVADEEQICGGQLLNPEGFALKAMREMKINCGKAAPYQPARPTASDTSTFTSNPESPSVDQKTTPSDTTPSDTTRSIPTNVKTPK